MSTIIGVSFVGKVVNCVRLPQNCKDFYGMAYRRCCRSCPMPIRLCDVFVTIINCCSCRSSTTWSPEKVERAFVM